SPVSLCNEITAKRLLGRQFTLTRSKRRFSDYNGNNVSVLGFKKVRVSCGNHSMSDAKLYVVKGDSVKTILGAEWFYDLGITVTQVGSNSLQSGGINSLSINLLTEEQEKELQEAMAINPTLQSPHAQALIRKYPQAFFSNKLVKDFDIPVKLKPDAQIAQHRGRVVPAALQERVDVELRRLVKEGHWEKLEKVPVLLPQGVEIDGQMGHSVLYMKVDRWVTALRGAGKRPGV
ncbi:MAG: hypothetical protein AAF970_13645, partial [Bacteroidota bacterium]